MDGHWNFFVYGIPKAQGRPRAFRVADGIRMHDPETSVDWKNHVRIASLQFKPPVPLDRALHMKLSFRLPRPKSLAKRIRYHTKKPDLDNLEKSIKDALKGIFYRDDSLIVSMESIKGYSEKTGVDITIVELPM